MKAKRRVWWVILLSLKQYQIFERKKERKWRKTCPTGGYNEGPLHPGWWEWRWLPPQGVGCNYVAINTRGSVGEHSSAGSVVVRTRRVFWVFWRFRVRIPSGGNVRVSQ